jgi:hypothetical protein
MGYKLNVPSMTEQEKEFYEKYWEAESKFSAVNSIMGYLEIEYGITGIAHALSSPASTTQGMD